MKKILSIILTLTATAALLSGCGGSKQAKAIVGSQDIIEGSIVSKAGGYFKQEMGPETEVKMFDAGRDINAALMSGSIDFGNFGVVPTTVGLSSGNDFKVIWIACLIRQSECLIVREGSGIETVADLKGRKVAATTASSGHYGLICSLEDAGLTIDDIELVDMNPTATYAAWERGDIDATYTWNPTALRLTENGGKMIMSGAELAKTGHPTINFHVVRREFAEKNPEQVKAYIRAVAKGTALYRNNEAEALKLMAPYLDMTEDQVKALMVDEYLLLEEQMGENAFGNDTAAKSIYDVAQFLKDAGQLDSIKDFDFYKNAIDTHYLEEVLKEGL
ncbi:MAG: ABC transporter substrate-binding protein [Lachnospiraceae bacterium]|nr:ABC transporter substrate-binding protein [Lachnospiraceae bacterium]